MSMRQATAQIRSRLIRLILLLPLALTATAAIPGAENTPAIRISSSPPRLHADAVLGYSHLQNQSLAAAEQAYLKALRDEPHHIDSLLALAALAQRQGQHGMAALYRQRALESDPLDNRVQALLLGQQENEPVQTESRLKTLLSQAAPSAALQFVLGNLYARQQRWREAQAAYFSAMAGDTDNPDYLYNLAVSLDHLGQTALAGRHYRLALEAAKQRPAAFVQGQIEQRLQELAQ